MDFENISKIISQMNNIDKNNDLFRLLPLLMKMQNENKALKKTLLEKEVNYTISKLFN